MADDAKETTEATTEAQESTVELSKDAQKVMDMVEKMTVLELSELVKAMEDKFGVSAAAPVAVAGAAPAGGAAEEEAEAKDAYDVVLTGAGDQKIAVIKAVREIDPSLGLVDAKNLVEGGEATIKEAVKTEEAEEMKKKLEEAGATVELR